MRKRLRIDCSETARTAAIGSRGAANDEMRIERGFDSARKLSIEHFLDDGKCHFPQLLPRDMNSR